MGKESHSLILFEGHDSCRGIYNSQAAAVGDRFDHRSGADLKLISSLDVTSDEQAALRSALPSYGPFDNSAQSQLHMAKKLLTTDLNAASPDGSAIAADAAVVARAKAQTRRFAIF